MSETAESAGAGVVNNPPKNHTDIPTPSNFKEIIMPELIPINEMDINDLSTEVPNLRVALLTEGHTGDCALVHAASADCSCEYAEQHLSLEAVRRSEERRVGKECRSR